MNGQRKDIVFLVADLDMEYTIRGLMARPEALGTRSNITFDVFRHPQRDPGVFRHADAWLRTRCRNYAYALVMFDREGCGSEDVDAPGLEAAIEERLYRTGWENRCIAVVLDPELEMWVFANSRQVINIIAKGDEHLYSETLKISNRFPNGKPRNPKQVMETLLRQKQIPRSSSLFQKLAQQVSLAGCQDRAFQRFRQALGEWFPRP